MTTQALPYSSRLAPAAKPKKQRSRPFLEALEHVDYGALTIHTPEGETLHFTGQEPGANAELILNDWGALDELIARGEVGFGEAYIDGRFESPDLPALLTFGLANSPSLEKFFHGRPLYALWLRLCHMMRGNSLRGSKHNVMAHYDLGNDFYKLWLDKSMTYSCGLFEGDESRTLEEAQAAKYRRILWKLNARPGEHILEIGCGWGGFAEAAAQHGLRVTAITLSPEQANYAKARLERSGLNELVEVKLQDYRLVQGTYDYVVSIGMFEHVGEKYWPGYFDIVKKRLRRGGRAMIQTITLDDYLFDTLHNYTGFIEQYIFPGGMLPSKSRFHTTAAKSGLACREIYGFGQDYARTLRHWLKRFTEEKENVRALGYNDEFMRLWEFYLASCIASFSSHRTDVMQAELIHV